MGYGGWRRNKNKFGAKRTERAGYSFASRLEATVFDMLKNREKAGEIKDLKCQVQVYLTEARIIMKPDFSYENCSTGEIEYCEAKGAETDVWRLKRRLWLFYGPGLMHVWKGHYAHIFLDETLRPKLLPNGDSFQGLE